MKTLLFLLLTALAAVAQPAFPTNVVVSPRAGTPPFLTWDAPTETNIVKHTVFIGVVPGVYNTTADVTTNRYAVGALGTGTFYAVVTATDARGLESDPSDELRFVLPLPRPARPTMIKTVSLRVIIRAADSPDGPWTVTTNFPPMLITVARPQRFYRVALEAQHGPQISTGR